MISLLPTTYALRCPSCKGGSIRCNTLGETIFLVAVDPETAEVKRGKSVGFTPGPAVDLYFCADCGFENVFSSMFVDRHSYA